MSNKAAAQIIGQITENLLNALDQADAKAAEVQNFLNTLVPGVKSGEITPDRIQILENGDLRILPVPPVTDTPPLTEQKNGVEPELSEAEALST